MRPSSREATSARPLAQTGFQPPPGGAARPPPPPGPLSPPAVMAGGAHLTARTDDGVGVQQGVQQRIATPDYTPMPEANGLPPFGQRAKKATKPGGAHSGVDQMGFSTAWHNYDDGSAGARAMQRDQRARR